MHEPHHRNLPWLEQLAIHIPGYGGYIERGNRRAADRALRDAIARRLDSVTGRIQEAVRSCVDRNALTEVNALERIAQHVDRVAQRVRAAGSGTDAFYDHGDLHDPSHGESLHAFDFALLQRAEELVQHFEDADLHHDFLANLEADLNRFERQLDMRTDLLHGIPRKS